MLKKLFTSLVVAVALIPSFVFARGFSDQRIHHRQTTPLAATSTPVAPSGFQFGTFNGSGNTQIGTVSSFFIGDGDSFSQDVSGLKLSGPLFVYWESSLTASQIASGQADSYLKSWASQMESYGQVDFAPLDEMNGNWNPYYGNPTTFKAAWVHIHSLFSGDSNVKFFYDPNQCGGGMPCSDLTAYYPGSSYVDDVGIDGFDFGGQSFSQVFSQSFPAIQALGKPIWLTSVGAADNQSQFISDMFSAVKTYNIQGIMYFNYQQFVLGSSAVSTLKSLL